jgi:hypothetical protein
MLPRAKYDFPAYLANVRKTATKLKTLCEMGHIAEQKYIKDRVDILDSGRCFKLIQMLIAI